MRFMPVGIASFLCLAMLAGIVCLSPNFGSRIDGLTSPVAGDFLQEWIGGYTIRNHGSVALFDLPLLKELQHDPSIIGCRWDDDKYYSMVYPPFYYLLFVPVSMLPYPVAGWLFVALMIGSFGASVSLIAATLLTDDWGDEQLQKTIRGVTWKFLPWALVAAPFFAPLIRSLTTGQKGTALLLIFCGAYFFLRRGKDFLAGAIFGLLAFKPHLAILIGGYYLISRRWRFAAGALATVSLCGAASLAMGVDVCSAYVSFAAGAGDYLSELPRHLTKSNCLYGFLAILTGGKITWLTKTLWCFCCATVVLSLCQMNVRLKTARLPDAVDEAIRFSALLIATLLLVPHLLVYDLTVLILPMALMGILAASGVPGSRVSFPVLLTIAAIFVGAGWSRWIAIHSGVQLTTLLMVVWFGFLTWGQHGISDEVEIPGGILAAGGCQIE